MTAEDTTMAMRFCAQIDLICAGLCAVPNSFTVAATVAASGIHRPPAKARRSELVPAPAG
jgi:hypothetical protein